MGAVVQSFIRFVLEDSNRRRLLELGAVIAGAALFLVIGTTDKGRIFFNQHLRQSYQHSMESPVIGGTIIQTTSEKEKNWNSMNLYFPQDGSLRICRDIKRHELYHVIERMRQFPYAQLQGAIGNNEPQSEPVCSYSQRDYFLQLVQIVVPKPDAAPNNVEPLCIPRALSPKVSGSVKLTHRSYYKAS